jgi:hypothetical protein
VEAGGSLLNVKDCREIAPLAIIDAALFCLVAGIEWPAGIAALERRLSPDQDSLTGEE